jgi:selenide,water dikinase
VHPDRVKRNDRAQAGDALVLGKPLGVGILSAALKKGVLSAAGYGEMLAATTKLNTPGTRLSELADVHALTDVTGFGLAGHLLEICRASGVGATLELARVPLHPGVLELAREGLVTGASGRNWAGYGYDVTLQNVTDLQKALLTDPQTSGGLLVACAPAAVEAVMATFRAEGFDRAAVIGELGEGSGITVRG